MNTNNGQITKSNGLTDFAYGKIPPQAIDLEEAVLGAILVDSFCLPSVINLLKEDFFYNDTNQRIYKAILHLYDQNNKIDTLTVIEQLRKAGDLEAVGGHYKVVTLTREVVSTANVEAHCMIIIQKYLNRELIKISGDSINEAYEDFKDSFEICERADNEIINLLERVLKASMKDMAFYANQVYDQYETIKTTGVLGIHTGVKPIDAMICGLAAPDVIILAARPSMGKTGLALSITHYTSVVNDIPCAWFSLEMNGAQLTMRLASIESQLSHSHIREGKVPPVYEPNLYNALDKISKAPIYIEDSGDINIRTIRTRTHILKRKYGIKYIVVDYLQLMSAVDPRNKNREAQISEISRGLKELARELNIPIIALSQLSRECEKRPDKMPQLSDLRESGAIEQDADEVIFLMRPEHYGFTEPVGISGKEYDVRGLCVGKIAKNRHGACGNFPMMFLGQQMHFATHPADSFVPVNTSVNPF